MTRIKLDMDRRTNEVRCEHRNIMGSVCEACFAGSPFLIDVGGVTYRMTGNEWIDDPQLVDGSSEFTRVSPATPDVKVIPVTEVRVDDRIVGYSHSPNFPIWVGKILTAEPYSLVFIKTPGRTVRIMAEKVAVYRVEN